MNSLLKDIQQQLKSLQLEVKSLKKDNRALLREKNKYEKLSNKLSTKIERIQNPNSRFWRAEKRSGVFDDQGLKFEIKNRTQMKKLDKFLTKVGELITTKSDQHPMSKINIYIKNLYNKPELGDTLEKIFQSQVLMVRQPGDFTANWDRIKTDFMRQFADFQARDSGWT